jgi:hypothetical protein
LARFSAHENTHRLAGIITPPITRRMAVVPPAYQVKSSWLSTKAVMKASSRQDS